MADDDGDSLLVPGIGIGALAMLALRNRQTDDSDGGGGGTPDDGGGTDDGSDGTDDDSGGGGTDGGDGSDDGSNGGDDGSDGTNGDDGTDDDTSGFTVPEQYDGFIVVSGENYPGVDGDVEVEVQGQIIPDTAMDAELGPPPTETDDGRDRISIVPIGESRHFYWYEGDIKRRSIYKGVDYIDSKDSGSADGLVLWSFGMFDANDYAVTHWWDEYGNFTVDDYLKEN